MQEFFKYLIISLNFLYPTILHVSTFPVRATQSNFTKIDQIKYLQTYGWLNTDLKLESFDKNPNEFNSFLQSPEVIDAIRNFQTFANIQETGELDGETFRVMTLPRCGQSDTDPSDNGTEVEEFRPVQPNSSSGGGGVGKSIISRHKRYIPQGTRWKSRTLKYNISKYSKDIYEEEIDKIIATAFWQWENVANITFVHEKKERVHIDIRFEVKYHGDEETFDGPGGTTAHAYFPIYGGDIHFDDDENWTSNSDWGVNLFQVATHEIGHALGLEHSDVKESVMAPFYRTYNKNFKLHSDDVEGIQALYGKRVLTICDTPEIDAATTMSDGVTYLFKGSYVYPFSTETQSSKGIPTAIEVTFPGLPINIDAAITRSNGISYIFKDDEFWRVTNMSLDTGFPKKISEYFPGIPSFLDAAMVFSVDDNIYFFKGSEYWKFDNRKTPPVGSEYPKPIYDWKGIPESGLDAAVTIQDEYSNNFTYFFKGNQFWKFNDKSFSVYLADPPYPRFISTTLYGCKG